MAKKIIDMSTSDLYDEIEQYEKYKSNLEEEIEEIEGEIIDLTQSEGEGVDALVTSLETLKKEYKKSLAEVEELLNILRSFYNNIVNLINGDPHSSGAFIESEDGKSGSVTVEHHLDDIGANLKINEEIITDELYPLINSLLDDYISEPSWFGNWVDNKTVEYNAKSGIQTTGLNYGGGSEDSNANEAYEFKCMKSKHETTKKHSDNLKAKIENGISEIKILGNAILGFFGEFDTIEALASSVGIDKDDYIRYGNVGGEGTDYGFDINNLNEEELLRLLEDETMYSLLVDNIGDGTLNEQINNAIISAVLEDDYSQLISIYENVGSLSKEEREIVLNRLKEVEFSIYISISKAVEADCEAKGIKNIEDGEYIDMQSIIDRMLQMGSFSNYLLENPLKIPVSFENLDFDSNSSIEGHVTIFDGFNAIENSLNPFESVSELEYFENFEFSSSTIEGANSYGKDVDNADNVWENLINYTEEYSESYVLDQIPVVGDVVNYSEIGGDLYSIMTTDEYHDVYIKHEGNFLGTEINGELYNQPHYVYMYMSVIESDGDFNLLYNYYLDMNKYIENGEYEEFYNSDEFKKYNQEDIRYLKKEAEGIVFKKIKEVEGNNE